MAKVRTISDELRADLEDLCFRLCARDFYSGDRLESLDDLSDEQRSRIAYFIHKLLHAKPAYRPASLVNQLRNFVIYTEMSRRLDDDPELSVSAASEKVETFLNEDFDLWLYPPDEELSAENIRYIYRELKKERPKYFHKHWWFPDGREYP